MTALNSDRHATEPGSRPFQFTLRTMFIVTTVVAVFCGGLFAPSVWARILTVCCWAIVLPTVLGTVAIYGRGYLRTFAIGGLFACSPLAGFFLVASYYLLAIVAMGADALRDVTSGNEDQLFLGICVACYTAMTIVVGLAVMGVRWMVESPQRAY